MSANLHSRQNHCSRKHEIPEVPEFSFLPDCRACRKRGVPGFLPVWLPCKKPGNRVLFEISDWQLLAIGAGSQVGVFEATKEQAVPKNMPLSGLYGRFYKTRRSQVFTSWPGSLRYRQTLPYLPRLCHFSRQALTPLGTACTLLLSVGANFKSCQNKMSDAQPG